MPRPRQRLIFLGRSPWAVILLRSLWTCTGPMVNHPFVDGRWSAPLIRTDTPGHGASTGMADSLPFCLIIRTTAEDDGALRIVTLRERVANGRICQSPRMSCRNVRVCKPPSRSVMLRPRGVCGCRCERPQGPAVPPFVQWEERTRSEWPVWGCCFAAECCVVSDLMVRLGRHPGRHTRPATPAASTSVAARRRCRPRSPRPSSGPPGPPASGPG